MIVVFVPVRPSLNLHQFNHEYDLPFYTLVDQIDAWRKDCAGLTQKVHQLKQVLFQLSHQFLFPEGFKQQFCFLKRNCRRLDCPFSHNLTVWLAANSSSFKTMMCGMGKYCLQPREFCPNTHPGDLWQIPWGQSTSWTFQPPAISIPTPLPSPSPDKSEKRFHSLIDPLTTTPFKNQRRNLLKYPAAFKQKVLKLREQIRKFPQFKVLLQNKQTLCKYDIQCNSRKTCPFSHNLSTWIAVHDVFFKTIPCRESSNCPYAAKNRCNYLHPKDVQHIYSEDRPEDEYWTIYDPLPEKPLIKAPSSVKTELDTFSEEENPHAEGVLEFLNI